MKADSKNSAIVRTVLGEVDPDQLGVTLMHEHPIHRLSIHSGNSDNTCVDVDLVVQELALFREAGGGAVWCTSNFVMHLRYVHLTIR